MQQKLLFLPGTLAGVIFFSSVYALATMVDGYSHVAQTVSEIGQVGSPAEVYMQITNAAVALCLLLFASGLYLFAQDNNVSKLPAVFMAFYAIAEIGVTIFPSPHRLHNVFGISMTIGYLTPMVLALSWKSLVNSSKLITVSWIAFCSYHHHNIPEPQPDLRTQPVSPRILWHRPAKLVYHVLRMVLLFRIEIIPEGLTESSVRQFMCGRTTVIGSKPLFNIPPRGD